MACKNCVRNTARPMPVKPPVVPQITPQLAQQSMTNQVQSNQVPQHSITNQVAMNQTMPPNQPPQGPQSWTDYLKYLSTPYLIAQNKENLIGKEAGVDQIPRFTPQQIAQQNALSQMAMERLQGGNNFNFSPVEQRLRRLYSEQQLPTIANRYLAGRAGNSSDYQNALRQGGLDLEERIGMEENRMKQQQFQEAMQLLGLGMQQQYENLYRPEDWGLLGSASDALFKLGAAYFGGVPGAIAASSIGGGGGGDQARILPSQQSTSSMLNQIAQMAPEINRPRDYTASPGEPTARGGELGSLQALVQNLGTVDVNRLRQQRLQRQLQQLRSQYNLGI